MVQEFHFHTIKSILNINFIPNIYILHGNFHTIKSILNYTQEIRSENIDEISILLSLF